MARSFRKRIRRLKRNLLDFETRSARLRELVRRRGTPRVRYHALRLGDEPIVPVDADPSLDGNVNGPSLVRAPEWVDDRLGLYYLYFAHHNGRFIRLAYADSLEGPWRIHEAGTLRLEDSTCYDHIASPDVHVDDANRQVRMYFHGPSLTKEQARADPSRKRVPLPGTQRTKVAVGSDGLAFRAQSDCLGPPYFRVFRYEAWWYALAMPGVLLRSPDGMADWQVGPVLFNRNMRHAAVRVVADTLEIFYTRAGDRPERIFLATLDLRDDWNSWRESWPVEVMRPERPWEGANEPKKASRRGGVYGSVRQLRDPAVYEENGRVFLVYSVAGEHGLGIAELETVRA